jgi:hypothetical protein
MTLTTNSWPGQQIHDPDNKFMTWTTYSWPWQQIHDPDNKFMTWTTYSWPWQQIHDPDNKFMTLTTNSWPWQQIHDLDNKFMTLTTNSWPWITPSGLWATSQGGETSNPYDRTQPFIEAFRRSTLLRSSDTGADSTAVHCFKIQGTIK